MRTIGQEAIWPPFQEGGIGEQGRRDRLEGQADAELLHHVGFRTVIKIALYRTRAEHHLAAETPDFFHIGAHDLVAALGHDRGFVHRPDRAGAKSDEADTEWFGDLPDFVQVLTDLVAGFVNMFEWCPGQFKLAAWLQADAGAVLFQPDQIAVFFNRGPVEPIAKPFQHRLDRRFAFIRQRLQVIPGETEFFMFGADAPVRLGFAARFEPFHQLGLPGNTRCVLVNIGGWRGHGLPSRQLLCFRQIGSLLPISNLRLPKRQR